MDQKILEHLANFFSMLILFRFNVLEKAIDSYNGAKQQLREELSPENRRQFYWKLRNNGILGDAIDYVIARSVCENDENGSFKLPCGDEEGDNYGKHEEKEALISSVRKNMFLPPYKLRKQVGHRLQNLYNLIASKITSTLILSTIGKLSVSGMYDKELLVDGKVNSFVRNRRLTYDYEIPGKKQCFRNIFESDISDAIADGFLSKLQVNCAFRNGVLEFLANAIIKNFSLQPTDCKNLLSECKSSIIADIPIEVYYLALTEIINLMPNALISDYLDSNIISTFRFSRSDYVQLDSWYTHQKITKKIDLFASCTKIGSFMGNIGMKSTVYGFLDAMTIPMPKIWILYYDVEKYIWHYLREIILPNGQCIDYETVQHTMTVFAKQNDEVDFVDEPSDQITELRALRRKEFERKQKKVSR